MNQKEATSQKLTTGVSDNQGDKNEDIFLFDQRAEIDK